MKVRFQLVMVNGPITEPSPGILDDSADRQFTIDRIIKESRAINGAGKREKITISCSMTDRLILSFLLSHSGAVPGKAIQIPAATWAQVYFPVGGVARNSKK